MDGLRPINPYEPGAERGERSPAREAAGASTPPRPTGFREVLRPAALACAVSLAGAVAGCSRETGPNAVAAASAKAGPRTVGFVVVQEADVSRTLTQPGTMQGIEETTLYARAAGYLKKILVDRGDRVRAGQLVALVESPELGHQQDQARASLRQSEAATLGVVATRGRAQADVAQAGAGVERARADIHAAEAVVARAKADQARAEAQLPRLQAMIQEAEANVQQAAEQQAQAQAEVGRFQQQLKASQATARAAQAGLDRAQADARLQQLTFNRLKAIQDKDNGLVAGQDVDIARAKVETSQSEVEAARSRVEATRQDSAVVEQQVEAARRGAAAAGKKVDAAKSRVQAAREDVQVARGDIESARHQVKVAEAGVETAQRQVGLVESQQRALKAQVHVVDAQIAASRQQVQGNRSAAAAAADVTAYTRIVAPFAGIVTERLVDPGALVQNASANQAAARGIVRIVRDGTLRVMIPVPERDFAYIRRGQPASLAVDAYPKDIFTGTVTRFASAVDPKSRTMLTEVDIPNPGGRLRPGMYARVTLTMETHSRALSVPSEAVMGKEDDRFIYLVQDGKAHKTPVRVGVDDGKSAEITEGLKAGSQVVVVGRDSLVDGAPVKAEPAKLEPAKK